MTLELEIDDLHMTMLERIEDEAPGDPRQDLERVVEAEIHKAYQQTRNGQ